MTRAGKTIFRTRPEEREDGQPTSDARSAPSLSVTLRQSLFLAVVCAASAQLGFLLAFPDHAGSLIWPPSGVALAALLVFGIRLWPGVFGATFLALMIMTSDPWIAAASATLTTLKVVVTAVVLQDVLGFRIELDRLRDVASLTIVAALSSAVHALIGGTLVWLGSDAPSSLGPMLWIWWRGDLGGVLALTPFLLLLRSGSPPWSDLLARKEFWLVAGLLVVTCALAFGGRLAGPFQALSGQIPIALMMWAGARLGSRGAVVFGLPTQLVAVYATSRGFGPFVVDHAAHSMSLVWLYCVSLNGIGLIIASAVSQRNLAELRSHREVTERLETERDRHLLQQRERIMREMHDGLGGQLVSLLVMVQRGQARPEQITEGLRRALDDMRIMIDSLETSREGLPGLLGKLRARLEPLLRRNGVELEWRIDPTVPIGAVDPEISLHCLRIIQEAMTNVIRHARAGRVRVTIQPWASDESMVSIEVSDDGVGGADESTRPGHGMQNMLARAREIGGEIRFDFASPGTRVQLLMPVPR